MAVAQNTVIIDDVEYKPGEQLPQLGSIHRVFKDGGKRHYEGLAKDSDKLPLYVANNSSCFMTDTGEYYKFDESKKLWYKPDKIEQSKVTPIEVYGVLNGKIQQVSEDVEGIATPLLYKGSVSNISQLPLSPKIGWMYNISEKSIYGEAGMNVAWTGEIWDALGPAIDMAPYLREDSEIITSLKTKTENLESANYTDRGTLADTDAFLINDGTGMKKSMLSKLSDFVLNKIADKVFAKLQTNDKTILGAINELNSKTPNCTYMSPQVMINSNAWCEIATFSSNIWNRSFFTLVCGGDICAINYGHEQDSNEYLSRCNAIWLTNKDIKVGFKVLDNILHIYIKNDRVTRFISICCLGLCTENDITSFKLRNTTLEDADMDKIY